MRDVTKKAKEKLVLNLLSTDNGFLERVISILYTRQTHDERAEARTQYVNQMGFNRPDALPLSTYAQEVGKGQHLTPKECARARDRLRKYVGQLIQAPELEQFFWRSTLIGEVVGETQKALQIQITEGAKPIWVPKSVIHSEYAQKGVQRFLLEPWFVEKEIAGMITGKVIKETDQALCLKEKGIDAEQWLPKSVIYATYESPESQIFLVAKWFLERQSKG